MLNHVLVAKSNYFFLTYSQFLDVSIPQRSLTNNEGELHGPVSRIASIKWKKGTEAHFIAYCLGWG